MLQPNVVCFRILTLYTPPLHSTKTELISDSLPELVAATVHTVYTVCVPNLGGPYRDRFYTSLVRGFFPANYTY